MTQPNGRKRATMKDVADKAGVSLSTVSYVINDSGPVAPDRQRRVLDAVRVLDYSRNETARSLKRRKASAIGLVVPELTNPFFALVAEGVQRAAAERDILVVLAPAGHDSEERQVELLRSQRVDGVVYLTGTGRAPASIYDLVKSGPVVLVDEHLPGVDLPAVLCESRKRPRGRGACARLWPRQAHGDRRSDYPVDRSGAARWLPRGIRGSRAGSRRGARPGGRLPTGVREGPRRGGPVSGPTTNRTHLC